MNKPLRCTILSLAILSLIGCTHSSSSNKTASPNTLNPTPPTAAELSRSEKIKLTLAPDNSHANAQEALSAPPPARNFDVRNPPRIFDRPRFSKNDPYISLQGINGRILTIWALARRNWLWSYFPLDSHSFGSIRNWQIVRSARKEHFRFVNQTVGTCMQAYGNGLIHDTCDPKTADQDFELLPTNTGSVFIKSASQQRCVTYKPVSVFFSFSPITLETCDDTFTAFSNQNWFLSPPMLIAVPETK